MALTADEAIGLIAKSSLANYLLPRIKEGDGGCLLWTGYIRSGGYAAFSNQKKGHRELWKAIKGRYTPFMLNNCGNRHCMNVSHWQQGSRSQMMVRVYEQGKRGNRLAIAEQQRKIVVSHRKDIKGSIEKARQAKKLYDQGMKAKEVAALFGIGRTTVYQWIRGDNWTPINNVWGYREKRQSKAKVKTVSHVKQLDH